MQMFMIASLKEMEISLNWWFWFMQYWVCRSCAVGQLCSEQRRTPLKDCLFQRVSNPIWNLIHSIRIRLRLSSLVVRTSNTAAKEDASTSTRAVRAATRMEEAGRVGDRVAPADRVVHIIFLKEFPFRRYVIMKWTRNAPSVRTTLRPLSVWPLLFHFFYEASTERIH